MNIYSVDFAYFLSNLADFLYSEGWYISGFYIIRRNLRTYEEIQNYLTDHCYDSKKSEAIVELIKQQSMNNSLIEYWGKGYNDYWNGVKQNNCPTYPELERRDAWMEGWLFAKWGDEIQRGTFDEN